MLIIPSKSGKLVDGVIGGIGPIVNGSLPQPSHSQHFLVGRAILAFCNLEQTAGCGYFWQNSSQVIFSVPGWLYDGQSVFETGGEFLEFKTEDTFSSKKL